MSEIPRLCLQNIEFSYDEKNIVLNSLSLEITSGKITAILGPNGSGKTTLLNILLGYLKPKNGEVLLDGSSINSYSKRQLSQVISFVPQIEHIPLKFTSMEYILLGRTPYIGVFNMPQERDTIIAREVINLLGIGHLRDRLMAKLSGGEQQLILLARALAQEPKILLLDEPTTHLDLGNTAVILNALKDLSRNNVTVVFTTHDPQSAVFCADQFVLMKKGNVIQAGNSKEIITSKNLTKLYDVDIQVAEINGQQVVFLD